jgi:outer membrane murein-binding lipoprotein Lpp
MKKQFKVLIAIAVFLFLPIALMQVAAAQTSDSAKIRLLTSRVIDVVNQTNKLTSEIAQLKEEKKQVADELAQAKGDLTSVVVFLYDFTCKWNKHVDLVVSKEYVNLVATGQISVNRMACDGVSVPPTLPSRTVMPSVN